MFDRDYPLERAPTRAEMWQLRRNEQVCSQLSRPSAESVAEKYRPCGRWLDLLL